MKLLSDREILLNDALRAGEAAVQMVRQRNPALPNNGAVAYAVIKAVLPLLRPDLVTEEETL